MIVVSKNSRCARPVGSATCIDDQRIDQSAEQRMPIASIADEHDELAGAMAA